jgi:hypothetical protein
LKGCGFGSISSKILDENGVKSMPGSILAPKFWFIVEKKIQVAKQGTPKETFLNIK